MIRLMENRMYIDSFNDVMEINDHSICFLYPTYKLQVKGKDLKVTAFTRQEMILFGTFLSLEFIYDN